MTLKLATILTCIGLLYVAVAPDVHAQSHSPQIWFSPKDPRPRNPAEGGSQDFMQLFENNAPWTRTAASVSVFVLYPQFIQGASDAQLSTVINNLAHRHIAIGINMGVLQRLPPDAPCGHSEGYAVPRDNLERIKSLGGTVGYINGDEPLWFGHARPTADACHTPINELAQQAAATARIYQSIFPAIKIGEVEPLTNWPSPSQMMSDVEEWQADFRLAYGQPLAFFGMDVAWWQPRRPWQPYVATLVPYLRQSHIPVLAIYNGNSDGINSDANWLAQAAANLQAYESLVGPPDIVKFQSWAPYPSRVLPENASGTFTNLVNQYLTSHH